MLAAAFAELGYFVEHTRSHAEAFAMACARDFRALIAAPFLRDGSALALPSALGIRRPLVVVLASRMAERLPDDIVVRAGFDAQWIKAIDAHKVHRRILEKERERLELGLDGTHHDRRRTPR